MFSSVGDRSGHKRTSPFDERFHAFSLSLGGQEYMRIEPPSLFTGIPVSAIAARIGTAMIGQWPALNNFAMFGYAGLDQTSGVNYGLMQDNTGATYLNAGPSGALFIRFNNVTVADYNSTSSSRWTCQKPFYITDTTATTSTSSGAHVINGGVGIGGDIHLGGNLYLDTATDAVLFNGSNNGVYPAVGGRSAVTVAANASLGIVCNKGIIIYRDETVGGCALVFQEAGTAATILAQTSAGQFTTTDPGAGTNHWFIQNAASHYGDVMNRYAVSHNISYIILGCGNTTFV